MKANYSILRLIWMAAIAVISVSCSKDMVVAEKADNMLKTVPGLYSFTIAAGKAEATRAVLDQNDYKYYWETGDQTALIIAPSNSYTPIDPANPVIIMTNNHDGTTEHTTFAGKLTQTQLNAVSSQNTYDYYSYFPYGAGTLATLPNIQFTIPSTLILEPNVFNSNYAPMVAEVETSQPPIIYFNGQELVHGNIIHFDYKHIMSYAAIEMDVRLQEKEVTSVTITNNSGRKISGTYNYNMDDGSAGYISGSSNSITIITEGFNAGDGSVLYVPMPPVDMTGENFTLTFQTSSSGNKFITVATVPGTDFMKGKIHRLRVAPAATYTETATFTVTKDGYYYIEAWGGNGGSGQGGASGGTSQKVSGLFQFTAGDAINVYIGKAGENAVGTGNSGSQPAGGKNGSSFGNGGAGGHAGSYVNGNPGGKGGGGGAGTFIVKNGSNLIVSGGGGGGGGKNYAALTDSPGAGGNGGSNGGSGSGYAGRGGTTSGTGGATGNESGTDATAGGSGGSVNGGNGGSGDKSTGPYSSGGGGGGGGGGYTSSGGGGGGGVATPTGGGGGGGGAGGANYGGNSTTLPGKTLPNTARPSGDGYAVITFLR